MTAVASIGALAVLGVLLVGQSCLPPIPAIGRPCDSREDCITGYFALLSGGLYCVPGNDVDGGARGVCLWLQDEPDSGEADAGAPTDAGDGDGDGGDAGDGSVIVDPGDRADPYACADFAPFVRGLVVAREDGAAVRQPLSAFDLPAPAGTWSVVQSTRLGTAQIVGADLVFAPAAGSRGEDRLLLATDALDDGPCADQVVAIDLVLLDDTWEELVPEAPPCTASACGKVVLTEDNPNLLAGRAYQGIAVLSGVDEVHVADVPADAGVTLETLTFIGAPSAFVGLGLVTIGDLPLGITARLQGRLPAVAIHEGETLSVDTWLRTARLVLGTEGGATDAQLSIGPSGWLQSDAAVVPAGPHAVHVDGALVARQGARWRQTDLHIDGALVIGGPWRCEAGDVDFGESGQVWVAGDAALDCPGVPLPDVWVLPGGRLRLGTSAGFTSFSSGAQLHSRGRLDVCRWEQLEAGDAPPVVVLDDGAELAVGTPLVQGQHSALLSSCAVRPGASVTTSPQGACGDPDVSFPSVESLGTRGLLVGCVGSDACPALTTLPSAELIDAPPGPYRPEIAEVAGGELSAQGFDLTFGPGFVGQRGTARVMSCTGPTFGVDIDAAAVTTGTWFWRSDALDEGFDDPDHWLDSEGKPADATPPAGDDTVLFILPGAHGPRLTSALNVGELRVMGGAELRLDAPLTVRRSALVGGRVLAEQNAGEVVLTALGVLPPDGQVAGHVERVVITDASAPELTSALRTEQLTLRGPDGDGLDVFVEENAHVVIDASLVVSDPGISLQLVGPADDEPTLTVNGTLDLGEAEAFAMFNNTIVQVRGGVVCDDGFPATALFSGNEELRFVGDALQPLACKSAVGAVPPQLLVSERARVQLDGRDELGVGVTRVGEGVVATKTLVVNGELLFFGPDLSPQQLLGIDAVVVGPLGRLRFPPTDPGVDLLGGASCTAATGVFLDGQLEGFDAWCAP